MSVMMGDATGEPPIGDNPTGLESLVPAEEATKLNQLLIDIPGLTDQAALAADWTPPDPAGGEAPHQATLALSVSDVMDLGTEQVDGLEALIIHGAQGDVVQLTGDAGYQWSRDETVTAPAGYDLYQASLALADQPIHREPPTDGGDGQPVYVLVQQDMTVVLTGA